MYIEKKIQGKVRKQMEKTQKEYYLNEQMKVIKKELGQGEDLADEVEELHKSIEEARMSKEAKDKALKELKDSGQLQRIINEYIKEGSILKP